MNQSLANIRASERRDVVPLSFVELLKASRKSIELALPQHHNVDRMMRAALTAFRSEPKLASCDGISVIGSVIQCFQLGLELGTVSGEAYLVPMKRKCQLIPGYKGLMKLARQSGQVKDIYAHESREHDEFKFELGMERKLVHRPLIGKGGMPASIDERGEVCGFYSIAILSNGERKFEILTLEDVHRIRDRSSGYQYAEQNSLPTPWIADFVPMGKKTAIRAICKQLPLSPELSLALMLDDAYSMGKTQSMHLERNEDGHFFTINDEEAFSAQTARRTTGSQAAHASADDLAPQNQAVPVDAVRFPATAQTSQEGSAPHQEGSDGASQREADHIVDAPQQEPSGSKAAAKEQILKRQQSHHSVKTDVGQRGSVDIHKGTHKAPPHGSKVQKWIAQITAAKSIECLNDIYQHAEDDLNGFNKAELDQAYLLAMKKFK